MHFFLVNVGLQKGHAQVVQWFRKNFWNKASVVLKWTIHNENEVAWQKWRYTFLLNKTYPLTSHIKLCQEHKVPLRITVTEAASSLPQGQSKHDVPLRIERFVPAQFSFFRQTLWQWVWILLYRHCSTLVLNSLNSTVLWQCLGYQKHEHGLRPPERQGSAKSACFCAHWIGWHGE